MIIFVWVSCVLESCIADDTQIFSDKSITLEDILKEKGQLLKKGVLGSEGDVEFWQDGSQSVRDETSNKKPGHK